MRTCGALLAIVAVLFGPSVSHADEDKEAALSDVQRVLGKDMYRMYPAYEGSPEHRAGRPFAEYLHGKYTNRRNWGIGLFGGSLALAGIGVGLTYATMYATIDGCADDQDNAGGALAALFACGAVGAVFGAVVFLVVEANALGMFIGGVVLWATGQRDMNRLEKLLGPGADPAGDATSWHPPRDPPVLQFELIGPLADRDGTPGGLRVGFRF